MYIKDTIQETIQRSERPRALYAIVRSYLVVVAVFLAFLLCIGVLVAIERFLLGWA